MPNRKQNIERIADACEVSTGLTHCRVQYKNFLALYRIVGERPTYVEETLHASRYATNQYVIDGMRLAAQRVIDNRKQPAKSHREIVDEALKHLTSYPLFAKGWDIAKPGSDFSSIYIPRPGRRPSWMVFDEAPAPVDPLSAKIIEFATAKPRHLAVEYIAAKERRDKMLLGTGESFSQEAYDRDGKIMDLADDIACARFGVGFYTAK